MCASKSKYEEQATTMNHKASQGRNLTYMHEDVLHVALYTLVHHGLLSKPVKQVWYWALRVYWKQFRVYVCLYVCMYVIKLLPNHWTDLHKNYTRK